MTNGRDPFARAGKYPTKPKSDPAETVAAVGGCFLIVISTIISLAFATGLGFLVYAIVEYLGRH